MSDNKQLRYYDEADIKKIANSCRLIGGEDVQLTVSEMGDYLEEAYNAGSLPSGEYVQSDWNESIETSDAFIKNKPPIKKGVSENSVIIGTGSAVSAYSISEGMMTQAGSKAFSIIGYEFSRGGFTGYLLDSAEGLEVGDVYSMHVCYKNIADENTIKSQQYINYGKITGIRGPVTKADYEDGGRYQSDGLCIVDELADTDSGYVVYVDKAFYRDDNNNSLSFPDSFIDDNGIDNEKSTFRILQKPNIGTRLIGEYTHAEGINTIAMSKGGHAEGKDTRAEGSYGHAEGKNTKAWYCAHAEGKNTIASGENSHAEGVNTLASLHASHAEGSNSKAISYCAHAEGRNTTASNDSAHAEGRNTTASGVVSHAEGGGTKASGVCSHAEGGSTTASANCAHAEGSGTTASGINSHAEGDNTTAGGKNSHAEGRGTTASGDGSHAEGVKTSATFGGAHSEGSETNAINWNAHAEGKNTTASGDSAHAEGQNTTASGQSAHAEGENTIASNRGTHAEGVGTQAKQGGAHSEGNNTQALEWNSHSEGKGTIANGYEQHVQGRYNVKDTAKGGGNYAHIVGNGTSDTDRRNIHTVDWNGNAWYRSVTSKGADYAEYFEWQDGNPDNEDRIGYIVSLEGGKIKFANENSKVLGIISGTAAVLGDNYECEWNGKYLTDDFGRVIYDLVEEFVDVEHIEFKEVEKEIIDEETNEVRIETKLEEVKTVEKQSLGFWKHPRLNPDYDPEQKYINRSDRPEWDTVGMLGKLYVRDDGTCRVDEYAKVGANGIATVSMEETNIIVLSRVNDNVIRVLLK